jgi:uncharacterized protein (TIGR00369 family)
MSVVMDADALRRFLTAEFPQSLQLGFEIPRVDARGVGMVLRTGDHHLRPGGTIMGPTLMTLADTATYLVILSRLGPVALAVTSSLEMHFLRKPPPGTLTVDARLLKLGKSLAVAVVDIHAEGAGDEPVAHATVTYAIPSKR